MTALTDRIAEVLIEHGNWGFNGWADDQMQQLCDCGYLFTGGLQEHAAHVAEQIETALHLTEETANRLVLIYNDPPAPKRNNLINGPDQVWATHYEMVPSTRYTTEWEPRVEHADPTCPWVSTWTEDTPNVAHDALQPQETASQHGREERR